MLNADGFPVQMIKYATATLVPIKTVPPDRPKKRLTGGFV